MSVSHNNVDINYLCDASRISLNLEKKEKRRDSLQQRKKIMAQCCCNDELLQISLLALYSYNS